MKKITTFKGTPAGDNECFCWEVTEQTFLRICGQQAWEIEKELREEDDMEMFANQPWRIYPNDVMVKSHYGSKESTFTIIIENEEE